MKSIVWVAAGAVLLAVAGVGLGLQALRAPRPFSAYPQSAPPLQTVPLPAGLPAPVERFYRLAYGERVPVITSAVFSGRGTLRIAGVTMPARARFTHLAGQGYRHYIENTLWGVPLLRVNEAYLDGRARMELPFGVVENEPQVDAAANLGLWAESIVLPALYVTDPRARWEALDETSARLIVPGPEGEEAFTVVFDPDSGLLRGLQTMRWKNPGDAEKTPWGGAVPGWQRAGGSLVPAKFTVTWMDEGTPWLVLNVEEVVYNTDVAAYIQARGP